MSSSSQGVVCLARQRRRLEAHSPQPQSPPQAPALPQHANARVAPPAEQPLRPKLRRGPPTADAVDSETVKPGPQRPKGGQLPDLRRRADSGETSADDCAGYTLPLNGIKYQVPRLAPTSDSTILRRRRCADRRSQSASALH